MWTKCRIARGKAKDVDAEELRYLDSHNGEGRVGNVDGETLFENDEDEDKDEDGDVNGQARKKEKIELKNKDYVKS